MCLFKIDSVRSFVLSQRIRDIKNNHYWLVVVRDKDHRL